MMKVFQMKRGDIANLPVLRDGELALVYEGNSAWVYVGTKAKENKKLWQLETTAIQELVKHFDNSSTELIVKAGWGIDTIKPYAFYESNLVNVDLTGIKEAGERSFYGGGEITTLKIPDLEVAKTYALYNLLKAEINAFPKGLEGIESFAFHGLGKNSGVSFDVEFDNEIDIGVSAFQEAKIKTLKGTLKDLGDSAFRNLGTTIEEIDLKINGAIGSYTLAGNNKAMFKIDKTSNITSIDSYGLQNFGADRENPSENKIVLDLRNSTFTDLSTYAMSGSSSSIKPKNFDILFPDTLASIGTYAFRYATDFRLFLQSIPALSNVNAFNGASNYKVLIDYNLLHIKTETNWSSIADNIIGYATGDDFGLGVEMPTHSKTSGRALEWFDDEEMTNQVTMVTDESAIYYTREVGEREVYYLEMDLRDTDVEVYNIDLDIEYTTSVLVPIGHELRLTKADPIEDYNVNLLTLNGVDLSINDEFEMTQDYVLKAISTDGVFNLNFQTATPEEIQLVSLVGMANEYQLGATRPITLLNGDVMTLRIVDNSGTLIQREDGSYAGLVFDFVELMRDEKRMNSSNTNAGGWNNTEMRNTTLIDIFNLIPEEWRDVIATSQVKTMSGGSQNGVSLVTSLDKLWLPSEREIFVTNSYTHEDEWNALQRFGLYALPENDNAEFRKKTRIGQASSSIWLRSADRNYTFYFVVVNSDGGVGYRFANDSYGVAPCFAI